MKVNTGTAAGTTITNTATASSATTDPNSANHSATATTAVVKANQLYRLGVTVTGQGSVTSRPAGISCPRDCSDSYAGRTSVTLTATPSGSRFTGWGGACQQAGTKRSCVVNMTADRSVKATFSKK